MSNRDRVLKEAQYAEFKNYSGIKTKTPIYKKAGIKLGVVPNPDYSGLYNQQATSAVNSYQNPLFLEEKEEEEKTQQIKALASAEITKSIVGKKFLWIGIGLVLVFIILVIMFFTFPPFKAAVDSILVCSTQSEQCMGDCTSCSNKFTKCC